MKKSYILMAVAVAIVSSCKGNLIPPRPTIPLVESIVRDTSGLAMIPALAGHGGPDGSIAIIGEAEDVVLLSRLFMSVDAMDNIDGRQVRDSLPDFAGEQFKVILDVVNAPYSHYIPDNPDSLREAAVTGAMSAWNPSSGGRAKILIFSSPLHSACGIFDVDTLQQLTGGASRIFSPVETTLKDAISEGAENIGVWAGREERSVMAYEEAYEALGAEGRLISITPDAAMDVRTQLRSFLRQWRTTDLRLDAIVLSDYSVSKALLLAEIALIRMAGTEEDQAFSRMISPDLVIVEPGPSLTSALFRYMRENDLFTHRIARPKLHYFETVESDEPEKAIEEVSQSYVYSEYVQGVDQPR